MPSDNRPLSSSNAIEFVLLCQGVWQLWACPLCRSGRGLAPKGTVRATKSVPSNSRPLGSSNTVEFVFLSQGVWPLWACPFYRLRWGLTPKGEIRVAKVMSLDSPPLVSYNAVKFVFLSQGVSVLRAFLFCQWGSSPQKWILGEQLGVQTSPVGSLPLVCCNPSKSVFLSQSVWLPSACLCWLMGSAPRNLVWGAKVVPSDSSPLVY